MGNGRAWAYSTVRSRILSSECRVITTYEGHGGSETASYAAKRLPAFIQERVATLLPQNTPRTEFAQTVSATICSAIEAFDDTLTAGLKNIFPESPEELEGMSDAEVRDRLARDEDGSKRAMLVRCMRGTTVVLAITDPTKKNMWIASLGDSVAGQTSPLPTEQSD
jgi:pyruvate dehydrogenase phosphatase